VCVVCNNLKALAYAGPVCVRHKSLLLVHRRWQQLKSASQPMAAQHMGTPESSHCGLHPLLLAPLPPPEVHASSHAACARARGRALQTRCQSSVLHHPLLASHRLRAARKCSPKYSRRQRAWARRDLHVAARLGHAVLSAAMINGAFMHTHHTTHTTHTHARTHTRTHTHTYTHTSSPACLYLFTRRSQAISSTHLSLTDTVTLYIHSSLF
jgi:hypothetical protein